MLTIIISFKFNIVVCLPEENVDEVTDEITDEVVHFKETCLSFLRNIFLPFVMAKLLIFFR